MSKNINVNPGNYKVAGRERQGEAILQSSEKGAYTQQRQEVRRGAMEAQAGLPAWETTPPNLDIPDRPKRRARKTTRKGTRTRKAAPKSKRRTARVMSTRRPTKRPTRARRRPRAR